MKRGASLRYVRLVLVASLAAGAFLLAFQALDGPPKIAASSPRQSGDTYFVFLPFVTLFDPCSSSSGISGRVTLGGTAAAGEALELRFYDGSNWVTYASTTTTADGCYAFTGAPALQSAQSYYVRYQNPGGVYDGRLWYWGTRTLDSYSAGSTVGIGNFDIANVILISPSDGISVTLPYTFSWLVRTATTNDSYALELFEPGGGAFWSSPRLGHAGEYRLDSLPGNYETNTEYSWEVGIYSQDGGYGYSYYNRGVTFLNRGLGPAYKPATKTLRGLPEAAVPNPRE